MRGRPSEAADCSHSGGSVPLNRRGWRPLRDDWLLPMAAPWGSGDMGPGSLCPPWRTGRSAVLGGWGVGVIERRSGSCRPPGCPWQLAIGCGEVRVVACIILERRGLLLPLLLKA